MLAHDGVKTRHFASVSLGRRAYVQCLSMCGHSPMPLQYEVAKSMGVLLFLSVHLTVVLEFQL